MKTILKIFVFLKVFGLLTKKSKKKLPLQSSKKINQQSPIQIGSIQDSLLKATVSVKGEDVQINISGFINELDAMLWAKHQSALWNQELSHHFNRPITPTTYH